MMVENSPNYYNVSKPKDNLTTSIHWARPSPGNLGGMSAFCFYYGASLVKANPNLPVGLIASCWGGTTIETWMTPKSLQQCGEEAAEFGSAPADWKNPDPGLFTHTDEDGALAGYSGAAAPTIHSTLWNSMIAPLTVLRVSSFLWYQGEANAGAPERYTKCFPAMIAQWRGDWAGGTATTSAATSATEAASATVPPRGDQQRADQQRADQQPFIFAQIAPWPAHDYGLITGIRYAQLAALELPAVGMAVTADIGDPAGAFHPIHPPFKQEVGRRAALVAQNLLRGNSSIPLQGPLVTKVGWDDWDVSWGHFHHGQPGGVCTTPNQRAQPGNAGWRCAGLRVTFDRAVVLQQSYGAINGYRHGFELWNNATGDPTKGGTSCGDRQLTSALCTNCNLVS
jgi:sialate O-acetylesterase